MKEEQGSVIYQREVLEFVAACAQYCVFMEQCAGVERREFVNSLRRLLALLYLRQSAVPRIESNGDFLPPDRVTEADYNIVREQAYSVLNEWDGYLDTVSDELTSSDETQWKSLSEGLADIYQSLRNFVAVYQDRVEGCMQDALWTVQDDFELYWGQTLVDTLRHLHRVSVRGGMSDEEDTE